MFLGSASLSAIIGSFISSKINRRKLLFFWIVLGALSPNLLVIFQGIYFRIVISILMGISLGLGLPSCFAFLAENTTTEERGRVSGIVILITFLIVFPVVTIASIIGFGLQTVVLLVLLRVTSFSVFIIDPVISENLKGSSWRRIFAYKDFVYYIFPWILVHIADGIRLFLWGNFELFPDFDTILLIGFQFRYISVGFFGLIAGTIADHFGRKKPIYIGLILMGVGFAFLITVQTLTLLIFLIISGVSWGFLFVVYISVLGDISFKHSQEKFYALGWITPILILMIFDTMNGIIEIDVPLNYVSVLLMIVLFLSLLPISEIKETLPESKMRERKVKDHIKKISKLISKSEK